MKVSRDYQIAAEEAVFREFGRGMASTLIVLPTGCGKSHIFAKVASRWQHGRVLVLAHRIELIDQAADHLEEEFGYRPAIEQGERSCAGAAGQVVVGSVQSMRWRIEGKRFGLIIIDESHRATAATYAHIIKCAREANPDVKVLGVTATPHRADKIALGTVFDSVAYTMEMFEAIELGWLVDIRQEFVRIEKCDLDLSEVGTGTNELGETDFNRKQLEMQFIKEKALLAMATPILDTSANGEQAVVFTSGTKHAHMLADVLNDQKHGSAAALDCKTPKGPREEIVRRFRSGDIQYLCNFGIVCLDAETEVLTSDGWVGIDGMTCDHRVANWDDGSIFFDFPQAVVRRDRLPGEQMVVRETLRHSVRVTEDHRMLYRTSRNGKFKIKHAIDLVGKTVEYPVSGHAEPWTIFAESPAKVASSRKRRIIANSHVLRKAGMPDEESKIEAARRIDQRDSLSYTQPWELTRDDCFFIGFWIGDGSACKLQSGGVEYTIAQSPSCPRIVDFLDATFARMGVSVKKRRSREGMERDCWRWSFPRGTGFGPQKREGLFRLEPYLKKDGTALFWGLNDQQFESLLHGLWMSDGDHLDETGIPATFRIAGVNRAIFDLLQAVATCRGYRASIRTALKVRNPRHQILLRFSASKAVSAKTVRRLAMRVEEEEWKQERVWCVTSTTGNIITRRRGSVTVTGNSEGFDCPKASRIIMGRPTRSRSLATQMLGRGTRPLAGTVDGLETAEERRDAILRSAKPFMKVLDFVGNSRHKPITSVDILAGNYDVEVRELAEQAVRERGGNVLEELRKARAERALMAEEAERRNRKLAKQEEAVRAKVRANVAYSTSEVPVFEHGPQPVSMPMDQDGGATDGQIQYLCALGVSYDTARKYGRKEASKKIHHLKKKRGIA